MRPMRPDCFLCMLKLALHTAQVTTDDEAVQERVIKEIFKHLESVSSNASTMEVLTETQLIVKRITECEDPYKEIKRKSNEVAMRLYPKLKEMVASSSDPLLTAARIAAAGNVIDFVKGFKGNLESAVAETMKREFALNDYDKFKSSIATSRRITYLADNAGEVVFDRVLIEELNCPVTYVVKSGPWGNDATMEDALFAGIDGVARVIACGTSNPLTILSSGSKELLEAMDSADVVIAKGGSYYEFLAEEERNIFYIFMVVCPLNARDSGIETGDIVLIRR